MNVTIRISQSLEAIKASQSIRREVFVEEQGIATELDVDGQDNRSFHILATVNNEVVGTSRITPLENGEGVLSRVAVKKAFRGAGIASKLVKAALDQAMDMDLQRVEINPHDHLKAFYETFGFTFLEEAGEVSGHPLIKMEYLKTK